MRWWLATVMISMAAMAAAAQDKPVTSKPSAADAGHPNVVLIVSDDQGWGDFGFMGHEVVKTPHLDRLAGESAVFPNGYVPTSLCRASLATLLTGLYGHQHRICCNDPPQGVDRARMLPFMRDAPALPRLLGDAGYSSLQTGKFWEGHYSNAGFTHGMTLNQVRGRHGDAGLQIGRKTMEPIAEFLDAVRGRPFFLWYAPMMPHDPHDPPERLLKKYTAEGRHPHLAAYYAMCAWFDETCGTLLKMLDDRGLTDNTLVIFVIDNGWIQDLSLPPDGRGRFDPHSKTSPYDGGVRTPIMLRWPGHIEPERRDELVSSIDIAPTILKACHVEVPARMPGIDLLEVLEGKRDLKGRAIHGEIFVHSAINLDDTPVNLTHRWVRQGDDKLILPQPGQGEPELYDIARDPQEQHNLAAKKPERLRELTGLIEDWWQREMKAQ